MNDMYQKNIVLEKEKTIAKIACAWNEMLFKDNSLETNRLCLRSVFLVISWILRGRH